MAEKYAAVGHIVQVIGPVLDVQFESGHLPAIYNAVRITSEGFNVPEPIDVTAEVQQHLGEGRVRAVAMEPTEGLVRGMKAFDTGSGITVPVGRPTLGRSSARRIIRFIGLRRCLSISRRISRCSRRELR